MKLDDTLKEKSFVLRRHTPCHAAPASGPPEARLPGNPETDRVVRRLNQPVATDPHHGRIRKSTETGDTTCVEFGEQQQRQGS